MVVRGRDLDCARGVCLVWLAQLGDSTTTLQARAQQIRRVVYAGIAVDSLYESLRVGSCHVTDDLGLVYS